MPKVKTERKFTRHFYKDLDKPVAERREPRVAHVFPPMSAYTAHPTQPNVMHAVKNNHAFIKFTHPRAEARIKVTGHYRTDAAAAEAATGVNARPAGHALGQEVWHHVADVDDRRRGSLQLVSHAQHAAIGHWGGSAVSKRVARTESGIELGDRGAVRFRKKIK